MTIKFSMSTAARVDGGSLNQLLGVIAQQTARQVTTAENDLTDSSGGTASAKREIVAVPADLVNAANAGTNLASSATALAKLDLVKDALLEIATKANSLATKIGTAPLTYNGGGTAADGTIGAIGTTTAAATGAKATETNASILVLNEAMFSVARFINRLCTATGVQRLDVKIVGEFDDPVLAITNAVGTAADPGVTKAALDAKLALYANNIATMAARLNVMTGTFVPDVVVVP